MGDIRSSTLPSFLCDAVRVIGGHMDSCVRYASPRDSMAANSMSALPLLKILATTARKYSA
jgi:hypothetical protein